MKCSLSKYKSWQCTSLGCDSTSAERPTPHQNIHSPSSLFDLALIYRLFRSAPSLHPKVALLTRHPGLFRFHRLRQCLKHSTSIRSGEQPSSPTIHRKICISRRKGQYRKDGQVSTSRPTLRCLPVFSNTRACLVHRKQRSQKAQAVIEQTLTKCPLQLHR